MYCNNSVNLEVGKQRLSIDTVLKFKQEPLPVSLVEYKPKLKIIRQREKCIKDAKKYIVCIK